MHVECQYLSRVTCKVTNVPWSIASGTLNKLLEFEAVLHIIILWRNAAILHYDSIGYYTVARESISMLVEILYIVCVIRNISRFR